MSNYGLRYKIGDVVNGWKINEILEKYKTYKGYICECVVCGNISKTTTTLIKNKECTECNKMFYKKFPQLVQYLENEDDKYKIVSGKSRMNFKCPICGMCKSISIAINSIRYNGFCCEYCSDNISYSEKFFIALFKQLEIDFICQFSPSWANNKRYDFLINNNIIVEANGIQHYKDVKNFKGSLETIQSNDLYKKELAYKNGITEYFQIDCRKSEQNYIKSSIENSGLLDIINCNNIRIDWGECNKNALKSVTPLICKDYDCGMKIAELAVKYNVCTTTISSSLQKGAELGMCKYKNYLESDIASILHKIKPIKCNETNHEFWGINDCCEQSENLFNVKLSSSSVSRVLKGEYPNIKGYSFCYIDKDIYIDTHPELIENLRNRKRKIA